MLLSSLFVVGEEAGLRTQTLLSRKATVGSCAAMVAIGGLLAIYGPTVVAFQDRFAVGAAGAGSSMAIQSAGAVLGVLASQPLLRWRGNRFTLTAALLLIVAGCVLVATAASWPATLLGAVVAGLGFGGCDALITQLFVFGQGSRGPFLVNIAHGCFGLGTVLAPAAVALVGIGAYGVVFAGIALIALLATATMTGVRPRPTPADEAPTGPDKDRGSIDGRHKAIIVGAFLAIYVFHFGVQSGIGTWGPTRLLELGYSTATASLVISCYWMATVVGRFGVALIANRVPPSVVVTVSCLGMATAMMVTLHEPATVWAYVLAGLCIGPIFPNGLTWLARTGYAEGSAFAYVMAGAMAGAAVFPPVLGMVIGDFGPVALAATLTVMSVVAVAACAVVIRMRRPAVPDLVVAGGLGVTDQN
jgi:FHS family glucose/mannose:H+ symporter-like MFS transporter